MFLLWTLAAVGPYSEVYPTTHNPSYKDLPAVISSLLGNSSGADLELPLGTPRLRVTAVLALGFCAMVRGGH